MKIILSIPDPVAHRFQTVVPVHQRSGFVTRLLEHELVSYGRNLEQNDQEDLRESSLVSAVRSEIGKRDDCLAAACRAANRDEVLQREIDAWQSFDDGITPKKKPETT
uniref:Uncharacterized protein n=1 Tax=Candidatus Kentrum sp. SD TaxID=2126332 RepID=A0A451BLD0_9GAMM|nr:MAG: hypothetical protein BECKSD772D_GA0070982_103433 [Candidatus Kentron sp. SD]